MVMVAYQPSCQQAAIDVATKLTEIAKRLSQEKNVIIRLVQAHMFSELSLICSAVNAKTRGGQSVVYITDDTSVCPKEAWPSASSVMIHTVLVSKDSSGLHYVTHRLKPGDQPFQSDLDLELELIIGSPTFESRISMLDLQMLSDNRC